MYSVLLDTNVILDYVSADRAEHGPTVEALRTCLAREDVRVFIPACLLKDVYFIYERHYGSEGDARRIVTLLRRAFEVVELTVEIVDDALESDEPDFEDGIVRATAEVIGADLIFSRDAAAFQASPVKRADAKTIVSMLGR